MLKIQRINQQTSESEIIVLTPEATAQSECLIGRTASCDLVLESFDVSRVHGRIQLQSGQHYYTDLGSVNGSLLNGNSVETNQNYRLSPDDVIRIGDFVLRIEAIELLAPAAPSTGELNVRCVRTIEETSDVKTFTLVAEPPTRFSYQPGQFVTLELMIQGEEVLRSYSISSSPTRPSTLEITVKRVAAPADAPQAPPGLVSNWLHDHLQVGDRLKLSSILGKFTCLPQPPPKLLLISAGSGITPMMSMSRWLMDTAASSDVLFFHCARTPNDIIFRQELELMAARFANFHLALSVTRSPLGQPWFGFTGRLTEAMLHLLAPDFQERTVYVCGPDGFMQSVKSMFADLNFPMQNYFEESFGAPKRPKAVQIPAAVPATPAAPAATHPIACFSQSGKEVSSDGSESILDLAAQVGIKIRSSCRQGVCGACKKRKLEGTVRYEPEPDGLDRSDQDAGFILTCVAMPVDRVVVEA